MASKRKRGGSDQGAATPASKITKTEEVTRSGRVRKRPAKFTDSDVEELEEEEEELTPPPPKPVQVAPVTTKPIPLLMANKSPIRAEAKYQGASPAPLKLQSPKIVVKSAPVVEVPVTPVQTEIKPEPMSESPDSADEISKTPGRTGRMRKKSAKVLEMEEFEEAERKTLKQKAGAAEGAKKPTPEMSPVPQEVLPPKKAYKATTNVPPLVTAALAAKIASSTPPMALKIKDMPVSPTAETPQIKTEVMSPVSVKSEPVTSARNKISPRSVANTIRLDQATKQDKGSVIKLLLSSPTQSSNPVLSTKSVAGTSSPSIEKSAIPSKKKGKTKEKAAAAASYVETSPTELPNLKMALSVPSGSPPLTKLQLDPNLIKQELPVSPEGQQSLKLKFVLNPEAASTSQQILKTSPIKTEPVKVEPVSPTPAPPKSASKSKKTKKSATKETPSEQEIKFSPTQMITPGVIHVPSTSGLNTSDHHLPPKKKKSAKIKLENTENLELEKNMMEDDFNIDLSALGDAGDDSLMDIDEDDGLMISEEDLEQAKPVKSAKKKKAKTKGTGKKGTIQLGDVPANTESELVMDFERMKQDDRKKKKQQKAAIAETEQTKKKRAPTAYMLWCSANRQRVVKDNPGIDFSTISKTLGELWSGLPDKDKMVPFQCDVCGKAYSSKCNLKKHQETHGPKTECYCGCSFSTKEQYARHLKGRHMGGFECTVCHTIFSSRLALLRHTRREHARTQQLECSSCGKKFGHKCHLREHFAVHTEETPYQCVTCGKKYKFQRSLRRHTPLCSGGILRPKPHPDSECHICGKMFSKRRYLTQHLQTHENSTKLCSKCGKKFVFESSFFKHVKHCAKK